LVHALFMPIISQVPKEDILKNYCIIFMDNISIYSDNVADFERYVRMVMDILKKDIFWLKDRKCMFRRSSIKFIDHWIDWDAIKLIERKIKSILK
jgi:hypothetical protein